jgi:phenylalanyl-tRNA synthetase alpha chain
MKEIKESLSPIERKILPFIALPLDKIQEKTKLDETSVIRALKFLANKKLIDLTQKQTQTIDLGVNGVYYKKHHLPERVLIHTLEKHPRISLEEAEKHSGLSSNEFKAALGALKRKALLDITNNKMMLKGKHEEIMHKFPEEKLLERLPKTKEELTDEERYAYDLLRSRKDIIEIIEKQELSYKPTALGTKLLAEKLDDSDLLEEVTPDLIKSGADNKQFRKYDIQSQGPKLHGGKRHFVNEGRIFAKRIWTELGFKEMTGPSIDSSFWIFDALFTAQDHPVREMQDTFYIKKNATELPQDTKLIARVQQAHEKGIAGSKGWNYTWSKEQAKHLALRTHTTSLSARTLASLKPGDLPAKYFAIGKAFRNETIDWSHGIEFYQTEGIVASKDVNFRHLLGYLKIFYKKMGFEKIRFRPSFFPYTEPSVEIDVFHKEKGVWLELGGAGMLRPEVTAALMGTTVPVLAWGQGLDRIIMDAYAIKDLRELYSNDLNTLRNKKAALI